MPGIDPAAETSHNWSWTVGSCQFLKCLWPHISEEMSCLVLHAGFRLSYSLSLWCFVETTDYSQVCSISFTHQFMCILWTRRCFGRKWSCAKKSCSCLSSCLPFLLYLQCLKKGSTIAVARKSCPKCFVEWWLVCIFTTVREQGVNCVSEASHLPSPHAVSKGNGTSLWWSANGTSATKAAFIWGVPCKDPRDFFQAWCPMWDHTSP